MRFWRRWRPALRLARRDLLGSPLRTVIVTVLVALPVAIAVVATTVASTVAYDSPNGLYPRYGTADALLTVTPYERVRSGHEVGGALAYWRPARGERTAARRDQSSVDVAGLLPAGSRSALIGRTQVRLGTGGEVTARVADLDDPLMRGTLDLIAGRAPSDPDEVAVNRPVGEELGLLDDGGGPLPDALLETSGGWLRVVGVIRDPNDLDDQGYGTALLLPPGTDAADPSRFTDEFGMRSVEYLVDLPDLTTAQAIDLHRDLAAAGVSAWMRDAFEHPETWGVETGGSTPVEPEALAVGALAIGLGAIEVVVLVGAAFAVGSRRRARSIGLLLASGGTAADARRTVLAQGVWIGMLAAVLGAAGGFVLMWTARPLISAISGEPIVEYSTSPATVVLICVLGAFVAVVAAALPARGVARMTASQALDGHVTVVAALPHERRHRLRDPGLLTAGLGLVGLLLCGWWIAREYRGSAASYAELQLAEGSLPPEPSTLPLLVGGLCALATLVGVAMLLPSVVDLAGRLASRGVLPWRLAVREAARHRGRTTGAVLAVGMLTTGVVFAGFAVEADASIPRAESVSGSAPAGAVEVFFSRAQARDPEALAAIVRTTDEVAGYDQLTTWSETRLDGRRLTAVRGGRGVVVVDTDFLDAAGVPAAAQARFAEGVALVNRGGPTDGGAIELRTGPRRNPAETLSVPAQRIDVELGMYESVWMPERTASDLGITTQPALQGWLTASDPAAADPDAVSRFALYGIQAYTEYDLDTPPIALLAALGTLVLTALVVGLVVALAASETRDDAATLAAVGAPPRLRRSVSAGHALFVGLLGAGAGLVLGAAAGSTLLQVFGTPGIPVPWAALGTLVLGMPVLCAVVGWLVAPTRLDLTRRTG